jgi:hypothetical protein
MKDKRDQHGKIAKWKKNEKAGAVILKLARTQAKSWERLSQRNTSTDTASGMKNIIENKTRSINQSQASLARLKLTQKR